MLVRRDADDIREIRPRAALAALVVVGAMLVLVGRLYQLQILRGTDYVAQSVQNFRKSLFVPADRGSLVDRSGKVLVDNRPSFDVYMTPAYCKGKAKEEVMNKLAVYLQMTPEDVEQMRLAYQKSWVKDRLERFKPFLVEVDIPRDQVDVLEAHHAELTCVDLIPTPHRNYRVGPSLGHVIGYMSEVTPDEIENSQNDNDDYAYRRGQSIGRGGLERRWERELRGKDGKENIAVDAKGQHLGKEIDELLIPENERRIEATPGNNLVLSLDARLQEAADTAFPGRAGAVVVMEAKTGFIRALVSRPSFDPNQMSMRISRAQLSKLTSDPLKPMLNRVMTENYHPGSTFKVVTSLAALEKGVISPNSSTFCGGGYTMGNHRWRCDKPTGHGALNVVSALKYSCDVFYYSAGDKAGIDAISDMAHRLGYGQPTGLDLGREITGIIPSSSSIDPRTGSLRAHAINASIGQGEINVTPLQQAVAYAAIANGGTVWKPQIIQRIESPDGKVLREFKPEPDVNNGHEGKLGVKPEYLAAVRAGLVAVVNEPGGTGYRSRLPDIKFAGKTGTAQVVKLGQKQNLKTDAQQYFSRDHAWFASFAPAEDPEIVVIVLNEHGGWGAEAAAPVASKIIKAWNDLKKQDEAKTSMTLSTKVEQ
ncbi:MAG: penicillin-binding protein 2 [Myxococcales bacterium]